MLRGRPRMIPFHPSPHDEAGEKVKIVFAATTL